MSDVVIKVDNLGKTYIIGHQAENGRYVALRDVLMQNARGLWHKTKDLLQGKPIIQGDILEEVWALKDVSFEIQRGEAVGIIGRNGAGKSTLLKVLSRITEPSAGRVTIKGRVASLLEVGTGFHPELTGRENIYLNGAILGMTRQEIKRKYDEIVAFAEVEKFLDTPVKRYSSGMYVRLAFAVAAHLEPEILVVDEVLAVGDSEFQKKCLGKMGDVAKEGRTVLFVSHNMTAIQNLSGRAIWIDQGRINEDGLSGNVVSDYLNTFSSSAATERVWPDMHTAPGNERVRLRRVCVRPQNGRPADPITVETALVIECEFWNQVPNTYLHLSLRVHNQHGILAFSTVPVNETIWHGRPFPVGLFRSTCYIPGNLLNDEIYGVTLVVIMNDAYIIYTLENALSIQVLDAGYRGASYGKWPGTVRPHLRWTTELIESKQQ
jgi:lipopolysaccharide transport system ATP-binding protein